jgi:hypothetical protein
MEEALLVVLGISLSEALLSIWVVLFFLEDLPFLLVDPSLFEEKLSFVLGVPCLHVQCTILTEQFTVVVGCPQVQGHSVSTEELAVTLGVSIFMAPLALCGNFFLYGGPSLS